MRRFLFLVLLLTVSSSIVFAESGTQGQIWLSYSRSVKKAMIAGFFLAIEYIGDRLEEVARHYKATHPTMAPSEDPPGESAEKKPEYDVEVLIVKMDTFYRRPGNANVPLKVAIVEVCIPAKESEKGGDER